MEGYPQVYFVWLAHNSEVLSLGGDNNETDRGLNPDLSIPGATPLAERSTDKLWLK